MLQHGAHASCCCDSCSAAAGVITGSSTLCQQAMSILTSTSMMRTNLSGPSQRRTYPVTSASSTLSLAAMCWPTPSSVGQHRRCQTLTCRTTVPACGADIDLHRQRRLAVQSYSVATSSEQHSLSWCRSRAVLARNSTGTTDGRPTCTMHVKKECWGRVADFRVVPCHTRHVIVAAVKLSGRTAQLVPDVELQ